MKLNKSNFLMFFNLFSSFSTLLCCALPALLVSLGAGAVLAGMISALPWLTAVSKYKNFVFIGAGILLFIAGLSEWQARTKQCPAEQSLACSKTKKISRALFYISLGIYTIGLLFAYLV